MRRSCWRPDLRATLGALLLVSVAGGTAEPAAAQSGSGDRVVNQLVNFVVTKEHVRHLAGGLSRNEKAIDPGCSNVRPEELLAVELVAPVELDIRSRPVTGAWQERWRATACGREAVRNALFEVDDQGRIAMYPLAPGTTRLSPSNQPGSLSVAIAMVKKQVEDCDDIRLVDTELPDTVTDADDETWREQWTFDACGGSFRLTMQFSDADTGPAGEPFDN
jgi:hypothetical protein